VACDLVRPAAMDKSRSLVGRPLSLNKGVGGFDCRIRPNFMIPVHRA
jgi:hypothetical protein